MSYICYTFRELKDVKMDFTFYKYHGAGNDFILVDNRKKIIGEEGRLELVKDICERRFGIGSDGFILIENDDEHSFYMEFYNPDGSQSFCGNGSRCAVMFAYHLGIVYQAGSFRSIHGINHFERMDETIIKLNMFPVESIEKINNDFFLDTGSPHYVSYCRDVDNMDVVGDAKKIRYNERFSEHGTNVNFIESNSTGIAIRTYERGVEGETFACGTGITAAAMVHAYSNDLSENEVAVSARGGDLKVSFERENDQFTNVQLSGPALFVFKGEWDGE